MDQVVNNDLKFKEIKISDTLLCYLCDKFLSVSPIYHDGVGNICGRCAFVNLEKKTRWNRQFAYEMLAKNLTFPCSNNTFGCKAELNWSEVIHHEINCIYKKLKCPLNNFEDYGVNSCSWIGSGPNLNEHIEEVHGLLIQKLPEVDLYQIKSNMIFFTRAAKQIVMINLKVENNNKIYCLMMMNGTTTNCKDYQYQIELSDISIDDKLLLRRLELEDIIAYDDVVKDYSRMTLIDLSSSREILKNPERLMCKFRIGKKSKKQILAQSPSYDTLTNDNVLRELECPVCKCYLTPPIFLCTKGHSICQKCKPQLNSCPTCRSALDNTRNFILEKITNYIHFPCSNKDLGCPFVSTCQNIAEHERTCLFADSPCIFPHCPVTAVNSPELSIYTHITKYHKESIIVSGDYQILCVIGQEFIQHYVIYFGSDIFRFDLHFNRNDIPKIKCILQIFGHSENKYKYEIEFRHTEKDQYLSLLNLSVYDIGQNDKWTEILFESLKDFVTDGQYICYKLNVIKC